MKILVEVDHMESDVKDAVGSHAPVVFENREHCIYVLDSPEPKVDRRRLEVERICENLRDLDFVRDIYVPGYRSLRPERWDEGF